MKSIDQLFKMDQKMESDQGVILDYGDFRTRVARAGGSNKRFSNMLTKRLAPFRRQMDTDTMDEDVATRIMAEVYADTVVLGMDVKRYEEVDGVRRPVVVSGEYVYDEGILRAEGVVPYTRENVIAVFVEIPEFFKAVQQDASKITLFREAEVEEDSKN